MKVTFSPPNYQPSGVVSFVPWSSPAVHAALRGLFQESPREDLVEVIIETDGMKAVFETRQCVKPCNQ